MKREKNSNRYIYSPSDLIRFTESEFASWMDRFYLDFPDKVVPDPADELQQLLQERGNQHEKNYLQSLYDEGKDVCVISNNADAREATLKAIKAGRQVIYQAALSLDNFAGYADFLIRDNDKSKLGEFSYQLWDTKLAHSPKPYYLTQLCCYAEMLESIQGVRPSTIGIILGDGTHRSFRTDDSFYYYLQVKEAFLEQQRLFEPEKHPVPDGLKSHGRWTDYAKKLLDDCDHLSRVANIRKTQIKKLHEVGICTMKQLADTQLPRITDMASSTFAMLKQQSKLQIKSTEQEPAPYHLLSPDPANPRRGLAFLPPSSTFDVCFDMEGYPHAQGGLEYLFGVTYQENGVLKFKDWWAHNSAQEKLAFEGFIDWVDARRKQDPSMHIFHYGHYEIDALRKLMGRHSTRVDELDELLRKEVFVDLFNVVKQSIQIGQPGYSIKNVELLYKGARSGNVSKAVDSIVQYYKWIIEPDGDNWQTSNILSEIRSYNQEDCDSTWQLLEWLCNLQKQNNTAFIPKLPKPEQKEESKPAQARRQSTALAEKLLVELPENGQYNEDHKLQELLAYLLEFHWREAKPVFWAMYDRAEMTEEELIDDINCLGGLNRIGARGIPYKQSYLYEYQYDPEQDTKIEVGKICFSHDLSITCEITKLDTETGKVQIKLGPSQQQPAPQRLNLIPQEYVSAKPIPESIYNIVLHWSQTGNLPSAIKDFLLRKRPRIKNNADGPIIKGNPEPIQGAIDAIVNLDNTTLCIQGPPGSGKTYTAAHAILELLKRGKKVGVSSNSHKAIANLMDAIAQEAEKGAVIFGGVKIQSESEKFLVESDKIKAVKNMDMAVQSGYQLIGGTAWAFSNESAVNQFDYLFVDEAGQVSIADLLGMSRSTKNIVLVGDQMQLSQPVKGTHPLESGQSTLQYLLQNHQAIPEDFGIFLGISRRMHPNVCHFISGAIYDNRLVSLPETAQRILVLPDNCNGVITKNSGILYVPIEHDGNTQASDEEVEIINEIVQELLHYKIQTLDNAHRQVALKDILILAPYNMQVKKLRQRIPGVDIGSVDKFQGLEAAISIISMCSSSGDASPRGIEFLFSKSRLNVAVSRAETLAIVVGHPTLARTKCSNIEQVELVNLFCRVASHKNLNSSQTSNDQHVAEVKI